MLSVMNKPFMLSVGMPTVVAPLKQAISLASGIRREVTGYLHCSFNSFNYVGKKFHSLSQKKLLNFAT
jgi:hypothetical protein